MFFTDYHILLEAWQRHLSRQFLSTLVQTLQLLALLLKLPSVPIGLLTVRHCAFRKLQSLHKCQYHNMNKHRDSHQHPAYLSPDGYIFSHIMT